MISFFVEDVPKVCSKCFKVFEDTDLFYQVRSFFGGSTKKESIVCSSCYVNYGSDLEDNYGVAYDWSTLERVSK